MIEIAIICGSSLAHHIVTEQQKTIAFSVYTLETNLFILFLVRIQSNTYSTSLMYLESEEKLDLKQIFHTFRIRTFVVTDSRIIHFSISNLA